MQATPSNQLHSSQCPFRIISKLACRNHVVLTLGAESFKKQCASFAGNCGIPAPSDKLMTFDHKMLVRCGNKQIQTQKLNKTELAAAFALSNRVYYRLH